MYFNYEKNNFDIFQCPEPQINNGYCIFHTHTPSRKDPQLAKRIFEKINEGVRNRQPILFIGFIIPELILKNEDLDTLYVLSKDETEHTPNIPVPLYLTNSTFNGRLEIINYHFKTIYFDDCTFNSIIRINGSLIEQSSFKNCSFNDDANFSIFRSLFIDFSHSRFKKYAYFKGAILYQVKFIGVTFEKPSDFSSIRFNDLIFFNETRFLEETTFNYSTFKKQVKFINTKFNEEANFKQTQFNNRADFHDVIFKKQELVFFNSDLSKVSFKNTDTTRIKFGDAVVWNNQNKIVDELELEWSFIPIFSLSKNYYLFNKDKLENFLKFIGFIDVEKKYDFVFIKNILENKIEILEINNDEKNKIIGNLSFFEIETCNLTIFNPYLTYIFNKEANDYWTDYYSSTINVNNIITIYRNLRENYEFNLRYDEAGKFFVREMELYRKYGNHKSKINQYSKRKNCFFIQNFSARGLYYNLAKYGESAKRPTIFGIGILLSSIIFFGLLPNSFEQVSIDSLNTLEIRNLWNSTNLDGAVERAWEDFIPLFPLNKDINFGLVDLAIKAVGGLLTFGFIGIALKRKFERKHRH